MNFKHQQKFANFINLKKILINFIFTIFTQHYTQNHKIIIMSKFQFVKVYEKIYDSSLHSSTELLSFTMQKCDGYYR